MQKIFLDCIGSSSKAHTGTFLHRKKRRSTGWRASTTHTASTSTRHRHASSQHPAPTPAPTRTRHPAPAPLSTSTRHRPVLFEVITPYSCRYLGNYSLKQAPSKTSSYLLTTIPSKCTPTWRNHGEEQVSAHRQTLLQLSCPRLTDGEVAFSADTAPNASKTCFQPKAQQC